MSLNLRRFFIKFKIWVRYAYDNYDKNNLKVLEICQEELTENTKSQEKKRNDLAETFYTLNQMEREINLTTADMEWTVDLLVTRINQVSFLTSAKSLLKHYHSMNC